MVKGRTLPSSETDAARLHFRNAPILTEILAISIQKVWGPLTNHDKKQVVLFFFLAF